MKENQVNLAKKFIYIYKTKHVDQNLLSMLESKRTLLNECLLGFNSENFNDDSNKLFETIRRIISLIDPNGRFRQGCTSLYSDWMWANKTETSDEPENCSECRQVLARMLDVLDFVLETGMAKVVKEVCIYTEPVEVSDDYDVT